MAPFGDWLARQLIAAGLRQGQLAAYLGVSPSTVSRWLTGSATPTPEACRAIARVLHVPLPDVFRAAGHPVPGEEEDEETSDIPPGVRALVPLLSELDARELSLVAMTARGLLRLRAERAAEAPSPAPQGTQPASPPAPRRRRPGPGRPLRP